MRLPPRLTQMIQFAFPVVLTAVLLNGVLEVIESRTDLRFALDDPAAWMGDDGSASPAARVESAELWYQLEKVKPDRPLCVIYGLSSVRDGFNADLIGENDGVECRYLFLNSSGGGGMRDFAPPLRPLIESSLKPDLVLLGIHSFFLRITLSGEDAGGEPVGPGTPAAKPDDGPRPGLSKWLWILNRRESVSILVDGFLAKIRRQLLERESAQEGPFGQPRYTPRSSGAGAGLAHEPYEEWGWYDLNNYLVNHEAAMQVLTDNIAELQAKGSRVAVILMPDRQVVRESIPPEVRRMILKPLRTRFPANPVPLLDLNDAVPDSEFFDHVHVNESGRTRLSRRIAEAIPELLNAPAPGVSDVNPSP